MKKRLQMNRRTVLRGMMGGATAMVGLPMLEAMLNSNGTAFADGGQLPCRYVTWFFGNGVVLDLFEPAQVGANWTLSTQLQPFEPVKDYVNVLTGFRNNSAMQITHHEGLVPLSGWDFDFAGGLTSDHGGVTLDQLVSDVMAEETIIRGIHVGVSQKTSIMDGGNTMYCLSTDANGSPQYPEWNPQNVWDQLFLGFSPGEGPSDKDLRLSVLDSVKGDISKIRQNLGAEDNKRLDAHLQGISELEKKINAVAPVCDIPDKPTETNPNGPNENFDSVAAAMDDLIAYAFKCDITRVATNMFIGGAAETVFTNLGQGSGHHNNSHSFSSGVHNGVLNDGVTFIMSKLSGLAQRLMAEEDPTGGNLLDSTIIMATSDCSHGWTHSINRQPIILIGHGRNKLKYPGIHYQATPKTSNEASAGNITDPLLTVLQAFNPGATSFGNVAGPGSNTPLEDIRGTG